ncbi:MAG: VWA domain-containing protein [Desulfobacteraceae bacterium]|nr:VWA domain-containing protein [Desulfobacteraceae bacterium]
MFRFATPWCLLLLIPAWYFLIHTLKKEKADTIRVSSLDRLAKVPVTLGVRISYFMPLLKVLAVSCMILALARPQSGEQKINVMTEGVNIILALDLSESMKALDFKRDNKIITRLDAVKGVVSEFIMERQGDRIGMVVFGSHAFTQLPLTRDYNTISFMLERLKIGAAGPRTAIGDAIGISLKRLEDVESASNIIILLTDGKSNSGQLSWQDAIEIAAQRKVKIHTIGVGTTGEAPFLVDGLFGQRYVYQRVDMDWEALKTIAKKTSGSFFQAGDLESLEKIYTMINALEKTKVEVEKWVEYKELYQKFLVAGLIMFLAYLVLTHTRFMRIP